jgi:hypothetical protein
MNGVTRKFFIAVIGQLPTAAECGRTPLTHSAAFR